MYRYSVLILILLFTSFTHADQFEQIDGKAIREVMKGPDAKAFDRLTLSDLGSLPNLLKESRAALLVVRTTKGNLVRLLVTPELRKPEGGGEPYPVFLLERFDTFDIEDLAARVAKGREIALYPGFGIDLDTAQIVPEGKGEDLVLTSGKELALVPKGTAKAYVLTKLPAADPSKPPQPTPGRTVVPRDFAGRYRLFANGQWSGVLDLTVEPKGEVAGSFRSDVQGVSYPVTGNVASDTPNKVNLVVKFPRSRGEFEGFLWTDGKGAIAGTFRLNDRAFGFFAIREGSRFAAEGADITAVVNPPQALVVSVAKDQIMFEGKAVSLEQLTAAIKSKGDGMIIEASGETPYEQVLHVITTLQAAGVTDIHLKANKK